MDMVSTQHLSAPRLKLFKDSLFNVLSLFLLGLILINLIESHLFVPNVGFRYYWNNSQLVVINSQNPSVSDGDIIKRVNGNEVAISQQIFPRIREGSYQIELLRNDETIAVSIEKINSNIDVAVAKAATSIVVLIAWGTGFFLVQRSNEEEWGHVGLIIQLFGLILSSIFVVAVGFPVGYFVGTILLTFFPWLVVTLTIKPQKHASKFESICKQIFFGISTLLAVAAVAVSYVGLDMVYDTNVVINLTALFSLAALATSVWILGLRMQSSESKGEQTNAKIVMMGGLITSFFLVFAIGIATFLKIEIPIFFIYGLWLLHPLSYLLLFLRENNSGVDQKVVATFKYIILLFSGLFISYWAISFIDSQIEMDNTLKNVLKSVIVVFLLLVALTRNLWIEEKIKNVLFVNTINDESFDELTQIINKHPDETSLKLILEKVCTLLNLKHGLIIGTVSEFKEIHIPYELSASQIEQATQLRQRQLSPDWVNHTIEIKNTDATIGLLMVSDSVFGELNGYEHLFLERIAQLIELGLKMIRLTHEANLLTQRVLFIEEEARTRIATELHNQPLQEIAVIHQKLKTTYDSEESVELANALELVSIKIREIIAGIQPKIINENPFWIVKAISSEFAEKNAAIAVNIQLGDNAIDCEAGKNVRTALYHIVTEAFNNILKHANASVVYVELRRPIESRMLLNISDDGVGYSPNSPETLLLNNHFGIASTYKWASLANGQLVIEGSNGQGTTVSFEFPLS